MLKWSRWRRPPQWLVSSWQLRWARFLSRLSHKPPRWSSLRHWMSFLRRRVLSMTTSGFLSKLMPSKNQMNSRPSWRRRSSTYRWQWWLQHSKCRQPARSRWEVACHLAWAVLDTPMLLMIMITNMNILRVPARRNQTLQNSVGEEKVKKYEKNYRVTKWGRKEGRAWTFIQKQNTYIQLRLF